MEPTGMEETLLFLGDTLQKCQTGHLLKTAVKSVFLQKQVMLKINSLN